MTEGPWRNNLIRGMRGPDGACAWFRSSVRHKVVGEVLAIVGEAVEVVGEALKVVAGGRQVVSAGKASELLKEEVSTPQQFSDYLGPLATTHSVRSVYAMLFASR